MNISNGGPSVSATDPGMQGAALLNSILLQTALQQNPLNALLSQLVGQPQPAQPSTAQPSQQDSTALMGGLAGLLLTAQRPSAAGGDVHANGAFVGTAGDEEVLVKVLAESDNKGQTYRQALESLHGVNNHTAPQWKDYYLDHAVRINKLVAIRQGRPPITVKKPNLDFLGKGPVRSNGDHKPRVSNTFPKAETASTSTLASVEKRTKMDSVVRKSKEVGKDDIPSRSPTPPSEAVRGGRGYLYTPEERSWFVQYVKYRLSEDPHLKKVELCEDLARKLPHHPASSWLSHWSLNRKEYDWQFAAITGKELSDDESSDASDDEPPLRSKVKQKGKSSPGYHPGRSSDRSSSEPSESDEETNSEDDRNNMSPARQPLSAADKRVVARYIASYPEDEWDGLRGHERWTPFAEMFPQRDWRAWAELMRSRYKKDVDALVKKYRRRQRELRSRESQAAKPSWAAHKDRSPSTSAGGSTKRPHSVDADAHDPESPAAKRSRSGGSVPLPRSSPHEAKPARSQSPDHDV